MNMITTALYFFPNAGIDVKDQIAQLFFQKTTDGDCVAMVVPVVDALVKSIESTPSESLRSVLRDIQGYVNRLAEHVGGRDNLRDFAEGVVSRFPFNLKTSALNDFPPEKLTEGAMAELIHAVKVHVQREKHGAVPA
jgi:hypothetical protein